MTDPIVRLAAAEPELEVRLEHFLRLQQRFSGSRALQEQVHADIREARAWAAAPARRAG